MTIEEKLRRESLYSDEYYPETLHLFLQAAETIDALRAALLHAERERDYAREIWQRQSDQSVESTVETLVLRALRDSACNG